MWEDFIGFVGRSIPHDVSIPLFCLLIFIAVFTCARYTCIDIKTAVFKSLLISYLSFVLWSTLIRRSNVEAGYKLMPYWNYRDLLVVKDPFDYYEIALNIALFVPIGIALRGVIGSGKTCKIVLYGCTCSIFIELSQLAFSRGLCESNDIIHNTAGCLLGLLLFNAYRFFVSLFSNQIKIRHKER